MLIFFYEQLGTPTIPLPFTHQQAAQPKKDEEVASEIVNRTFFQDEPENEKKQAGICSKFNIPFY